MSKYKNEQEKLTQTNKKMLKELKENNINKVIISSVGNSISTGFSLCNANAPLFTRNKTLKRDALSSEIELETHQYARSENNSDEHILDAFTNNKKESEFNKESRRDYNAYLSKNHVLLTPDEIDIYYPLELDKDKGIKDTLLEKENNMANIVIYNGATGSLLDNASRHGKHLINGIRKDLGSVEALLSRIQLHNRESYGNTQVYLCGAPRILLPFASSLTINSHLYWIAQRYANTTYVPSFSRQKIYKSTDIPIPIPDPHYNEDEYCHLLNEIERKITDSFQETTYLINLDRIFSKLSKDIEMGNIDSKKITKNYILEIIEKFAILIEKSGKDKNEFLRKANTYFIERYPYDFYFINHKILKDSCKILKK